MSMTLEEFYRAFETAHRKYPMQVIERYSHYRKESSFPIRHRISQDYSYCPITAVACNLDVDPPEETPVPNILGLFNPEFVGHWASSIGLSDRDTTLIITAADDEILISLDPQVDVKIKEIRERLLAIVGNTSEHES